MGELLQQTLELYSEPWKKDHDEVMGKYDAADGMGEAVSFGVFLFDRLYAKLTTTGAAKVSTVEPAFAAFHNWYSATSRVLSVVDRLESDGFPVDGSNSLRERHIRAAAIIEELHDARRAIASVKKETAVTLADYLDELRNPIHG